MIKNILSIIKPNELENYAKEISQHNFFELFSEEINEIHVKNFTYFLYFGEAESKAYIEDYMLFTSKVYGDRAFDQQNYFSVFEEFKLFIEKEDVYFKYKTIHGAKYANQNTNITANLVENNFLSQDNKCIVTKQKYTYPFFEYLEGKILSTYKNENTVIERLESEDLMHIQEIFMDKISLKEPPFYLNPNNKTYKYSRQMIVNNILPMTPAERAYVCTIMGKIVGIIFATQPIDDKVTFTIMTDMDYMDSNFASVINGIKCLYKGKCKNLVIRNINRGIASSNLNTACILAHFTADYDHAENIDGYTQYNHKYTYNDQDEVENFIPQNPIKLITSNIK